MAKNILATLCIVGGYLILIESDGYSANQPVFVCLFKSVTSIPCPGCGMGRATIELFRGHLIKSFEYNILCLPFTIGVIISICWLVRDILLGNETFFQFAKQDIKQPYKLGLLLLLILNWVVNIIRHI